MFPVELPVYNFLVKYKDESAKIEKTTTVIANFEEDVVSLMGSLVDPKVTEVISIQKLG